MVHHQLTSPLVGEVKEAMFTRRLVYLAIAWGYKKEMSFKLLLEVKEAMFTRRLVLSYCMGL